MGWSEDLLFAGLITTQEYEEMQDSGSNIFETGDTEALQDLFQIAYENGLDELGDRLIDDYNASINFYEEANEYRITYDDSISRWRDVETGRFVSDPYVPLR